MSNNNSPSDPAAPHHPLPVHLLGIGSGIRNLSTFRLQIQYGGIGDAGCLEPVPDDSRESREPEDGGDGAGGGVAVLFEGGGWGWEGWELGGRREGDRETERLITGSRPAIPHTHHRTQQSLMVITRSFPIRAPRQTHLPLPHAIIHN